MADRMDPNIRPLPRLDLVTPAGEILLKRDPEQYAEEQRIIAEAPKDTEQEEADRERDKSIVREALDFYELVIEVEGDQRRREVDDLKFDRALEEDQWPADVLEKRRKVGKAIVTIPKLDQPVQQVVNEGRQARLAVQIKARGKGADKDGAEVRQGMYRSIEVDSRAQLHRMWAFERAVKCGRGAYRITTEYSNDGDFYQDIVIKRILNQGAVYFDPFAIEPDWSDGEKCLITEDMSWEKRKRHFPDAAFHSADEMSAEGDVPPEWATEDTCRVAEYYRVVHEKRILVADPVTGEAKLLPKEFPVPNGVASREVMKRKVEWFVIDGVQVLDREDWPGRYIPVVPVIGKEYQVDGRERVFKGLISNAKDSARMYNYMSASQIDAARMTTQDTYIVDPKQIEGYRKVWTDAGIRLLPYNMIVNGIAVPRPERTFEEPEFQVLTAALREADGNIKAVTGRFDPSLGNTGSERSGKAIRELKQQGENSTSQYLENLATCSMTYEAKVILDLMPHIYREPGRVMRLLGEEDTERTVMLNADFAETPDGPVPWEQPGLLRQAVAPVRAAAGRITGRAPAKPLEKKRYDIREGEYSCVVSVGRSYQTQKDADNAVVGALMESGLAPQIADLYAETLEGPMGARIAKRLRDLNPALKGDDEDGEPEVPPAIQQQLQQSGQMIEQLTAALQAAQQEKQAETAKIESQVIINRERLASAERIAKANLEIELAKAQMGASSKENLAVLQAGLERAKQALEHEHDLDLADLEEEGKKRSDVRKAVIPPLEPVPAIPEVPITIDADFMRPDRVE